MKKIILSAIVLITFNSFSQSKKTCDSKENALEDLNSIAKCTIQSSKKSNHRRARQISVKISASRAKKHFLKKRASKKQLATTTSISSSGVSNLNSSADINNSLSLKSNLANITNRLSAEEIRKADKFTTVDVIPTFEGCKNAKKGDKMDCFNTEMIKHIQTHFHYPNDAILKKLQGNVWVRFIIDKDGTISNIKTLEPRDGKILGDEAKRVVSLLPKFIPATRDGKAVSVKYGLPISFYLGEE